MPSPVRTVLALLLLVVSARVTRAQAPPVVDFAIRDVTVVPCTGAAPMPGRTVVVTNGRIHAIGGADLAVDAALRTLDGHGRWLIPGLWDMHVHMTAMPHFAALYVANGITGVRDMFGMIGQMASVRQAIAAGERPGPRIVAAGRIVDGQKPIWPGSFEAVTAADGQKAVATVTGEGSDFVKVYSKLSRAAFFAIAVAARAQGVPFAGHVPYSVTVAEAAAAGQRSIEHLTGVLEACCGDPARARDRSIAQAERWALVVDGYDAAKAAALASDLAALGTWMCPTLVVLHSVANLDDAGRAADPRMRYMPPFLERMWDPGQDFRFKSWTKDDWAAQRRVFAQNQVVVRALRDGGVHFLAGTDTGNPYCFPGFSLHDELQALVACGLTPAEALAAATVEPARYFGLEQDLGTVAEGKVATLVLLDADPLADIANTKKIAAVVAEGRLYERAQLDALLAAAARTGD